MENKRVDYKDGAKVGDAVAPEDLPSRRTDAEPDREAARAKGGGAGARNVHKRTGRDAALEQERGEP